MKLAPPQLDRHLAGKLAPVYIISSDESLLLEETRDLIRQAAINKGYDERIRIAADSGSHDWGKQLYGYTHSLSLLSNKRLLELSLQTVKFNPTNTALLQEYAEKPQTDTLLLILMGKIDPQHKWIKQIEPHSVIIQLWPIPTPQLPAWILQRAKQKQLALNLTQAELLATRVEGNLFAAAQEIEKLSLLQADSTIDAKTFELAITDSAHYTIFDLVDAALAGNLAYTTRILNTLAEEKSEPVLIVWAIARELRTLAHIFEKIQQGMSIGSLFSQYRIWEARQPKVRAFLKRHTLQSCYQLILRAAALDRMIKGAHHGNIWDELAKLTLLI